MNKFKRGISILLTGALLFATIPGFVFAKTVEELRAELDDKRDALKSTQEKIEEFKDSIQTKKQEARTLEDQIGLIDDSITEIELTLDQTLAEIDATDVEIESVEQDIKQKEEEISAQKKLLAEYLRSIHDFDQQSNVAVFLKYDTFSEALTESETLLELQSRGQQTLNTIQQLHEDLLTKRRELQDFRDTLNELKQRQVHQQETLQTQKDSKQRILELTNAQESQYQDLLLEAQRSQKEAESAIKDLDSRIREELRKQGIGALPSVGVFDWPIDPIFGVACEFHCTGYPYAYLIGPHSGMDIPTYVGTPIKAPADGYVARVHDSGGTGYSYIMLIHGDNLSTIYGHVSGFAVNEGQLVTRGTVIGYTGGAAGAHGSGLSTGPHLHFEVRENNIPVNPRKYL